MVGKLVKVYEGIEEEGKEGDLWDMECLVGEMLGEE